VSTALRAAFHAAFGRDPDGLWAAPGRVNLIGEHVDYAAGLCLPLALSQRTVVAAAVRDDGLLRLRHRIGVPSPGTACWRWWVLDIRRAGRPTPRG
jgi:galactokinase